MCSLAVFPALREQYGFWADRFTASPYPTPSGFVSKIILAEGARGEFVEPVNPTAVYKPTSIVHAIVSIQNVPSDSAIDAYWRLGTKEFDFDPNGTVVFVRSGGTRNLDFTLKPVTQLSPGLYILSISVNGKREATVDFTVK
jgi:hypothetical protein